MTPQPPKFDLPEYDELTAQPVMKKADLKDGSYYLGRCRNASVARWNAAEQCFYHWREKFGSIFTETIKHPVDDDHFDVFRVLEELPNPKFEIPFDNKTAFAGRKEDLYEHNTRVWCSCGTGRPGPCIAHMDTRNRSCS